MFTLNYQQFMSIFPSLVRNAFYMLCAVTTLSSSAEVRAMHGLWLRLSEPNAVLGYYYDPLSIKQVKEGFTTVTTMINYISDTGNKESLLGVTVFDCARRVRQEQSTVQYTQYWADGVIKLKLGLEEPWDTVKVGTDGMQLLKTVCAPAGER